VWTNTRGAQESLPHSCLHALRPAARLQTIGAVCSRITSRLSR
jgi:hypothetical protein